MRKVDKNQEVMEKRLVYKKKGGERRREREPCPEPHSSSRGGV